MKKDMYCSGCNYSFNYEIKSIKALDSVICPKCGKKVSLNSRKPLVTTKSERVVSNIAMGVFNFYYYFYFLISLIGLLGLVLNFNKLVMISAMILGFVYLIELLIGIDRNIFGFIGVTLSSIICIYIFKDISKGITLGIIFCFLISSFIKIIFNLFIRFLYRKYG